MWTIAEMKARGRKSFTRNYWKCIIVALIFAFISAGASSGNNGNSNNTNDTGYSSNGYYVQEDQLFNVEIGSGIGPKISIPGAGDVIEAAISPFAGTPIFSALGVTVTAATIIAAIIWFILLTVFFNCLEVGCRRYFLYNLEEPATLGHLLYNFRENWGNTALVMFLTDVKIFLFYLLLIVPGIIKTFEYRMVPYIIAENPHMSASEAQRISKEMMMGSKWESFLLDFSFIGWDILSAFTAGLVGLFYSNAYQYSTHAALYEYLSANYYGDGPYNENDPYYNNVNPYENTIDGSFRDDQ